jgi:hypothetical protein
MLPAAGAAGTNLKLRKFIEENKSLERRKAVKAETQQRDTPLHSRIASRFRLVYK